MSRLITEPNSCIRSVISLRDAPAPAPKSLQKRGRREEEKKKQRTNAFFSSFLFQENSLVSAPFHSEAPRLRLRENGCINELLFLSEDTFPPPACSLSLYLSFPLTQETASNPLTPAFYPLCCSLAFILHLTGAFGRLQILFFFLFSYNHIEKGICKTFD